MKKVHIYFFVLVSLFFIMGCNNKHTHHFENYQCGCGEVEELTVTLVDNDNTTLVKVKYGQLIDSSYFEVNNDLFIGWFLGDEIFNTQEAILSPITLVSKYYSTDLDYNINYVIDSKYLYYQSKDEMVLDFLKDFYYFVSPKESLKTFIYGINGNEPTWVNYIGGSEGAFNYLLYNNDIDVLNNDYFFNSEEYKDKWYILSSYVKEKICFNNKRFGYPEFEYNYGALDFKRYIINDPNIYISTYGGEENFYGFPHNQIDFVESYKYISEDISLLKPFSEFFDGWYLDQEFTDGPYITIEKGSFGDKTFYAKIKEEISYSISFEDEYGFESEDIIIKKGDNVTLPTLEKPGYTFLGWQLDYELFENEFEFNFDCSISLEAKWQKDGEMTYHYLEYNDKVITYHNNYVAVEIPNEYVQKEEELRACWESSYISDFLPSTDPETMKKELLYVLDFLESYNMNCMFFHLRTHNNAFYKTTLAPIHSSYGTIKTFEEWDYLEWLIEECHKRGIEFHAWLNPYRIELSGLSLDTTVYDISKRYVDYPNNPASNPDNILLTYVDGKTQGAILNPAKEDVQNHIVDVCMEIVNNYSVDGIHFDDYFYQKFSENSNILEELDQIDFEMYIENNQTNYNLNSVSDKENWRRNNVDNLIYQISLSLEEFNFKNNKEVVFGISPTGVYKSGDGTVESGSSTRGTGHYGGYHYCDTVKWVNEGWIDYIIPQCYTSFDNKNFSFQDITTWWNQVVDGKNVNLYIGIGLNLSINETYKYSLATQKDELINQFLFLNDLENVKGVSIFSFGTMKKVVSSDQYISHEAFIKIHCNFWINKVKAPRS